MDLMDLGFKLNMDMDLDLKFNMKLDSDLIHNINNFEINVELWTRVRLEHGIDGLELVLQI
jgi:hypothetical protein